MSVAATALLSRDTTKNLLSLVGEKLDRLNASVNYVQGKIDGLERILSDGVISPNEVEQIRDGAKEIKGKIGDILGRRGDAV